MVRDLSYEAGYSEGRHDHDTGRGPSSDNPEYLRGWVAGWTDKESEKVRDASFGCY